MTFPYIFLLDDFSLYFPISWLFPMGSHWSHWKVKSWLSALAVSNGGRGIFPFPYIFLLVDHFKWALIGHIEKWRLDSVLWQFRMGGMGDISISLYILISWLFQMGSHWWHWTAKSWLSVLAVLNGGGVTFNCQFYPGKSENLSSFQVLLLLHRALSFLIRNERPMILIKH